jgi:hypothetical protein
LNPEDEAHLELAASREELSHSLTRQVEFLVKHLDMTPDEAAATVRETPRLPPEEQVVDQVSWYDLGRVAESDPARAETLWRRIKDAAALELQRGVRTARSVERDNAQPIDRARVAAIFNGLVRALQPRDSLEEMLIQQMASAYHLHLVWQEQAADRAQQDAWEGERDRRNELRNMSPERRERYEAEHGWLPPRVSTAAAIDQAVLIADRYQRSFLRLMKAFRDNRRLFASLVVAGGQVNIAEQQVVASEAKSAARSNRSKFSHPRRTGSHAKIVGNS